MKIMSKLFILILAIQLIGPVSQASARSQQKKDPHFIQVTRTQVNKFRFELCESYKRGECYLLGWRDYTRQEINHFRNLVNPPPSTVPDDLADFMQSCWLFKKINQIVSDYRFKNVSEKITTGSERANRSIRDFADQLNEFFRKLR